MLCNLQIFSGCVCHLEQLHAQSPFLFPIVFSINLIPFFDISSVLAVHSPGLFGYVLLYFTWATARSQELLFVVLACHALRALDSSCRLRTRRRVCICIGSTRCRGNHMHDHSRFQRDIDDVTGVSLSLSLYYSQKSLTHNIGSASALPIIEKTSTNLENVTRHKRWQERRRKILVLSLLLLSSSSSSSSWTKTMTNNGWKTDNNKETEVRTWYKKGTKIETIGIGTQKYTNKN